MRLLEGTIGAMGVVFALAASAQTYPSKPIRIIVGPGPDIVARIFGQKFTDAWGQQVVVDTRPGAGGAIATDIVAKAAPDGYTMLLASASYTINAVLQPSAFDLIKDFAPVAFCASSPFILVINPSLPANTLAELIALAKSQPGKINYGSSGNGTPPHLAGELFKSMAHINITHVPYKSAAPAMVDVIAGQVQMAFMIVSVSLPHVQSGKVRGLAVSSLKRSRLVPDLPTLAESGLPGFEVIGWNGLLAPAGTPKAITTKLNSEIMHELKQSEVSQRLLGAGYEPSPEHTPDQFGEYMKDEIAKWKKVVKESGMKVD
jgi:tripartite-type tricarboxylate transporter receptor subunit TctC